MNKPLPEGRFKYTEDNPQAAMSGMLADYMRENHLTGKMPVDDAQTWFYGLRDAFKQRKTADGKYVRRSEEIIKSI